MLETKKTKLKTALKLLKKLKSLFVPKFVIDSIRSHKSAVKASNVKKRNEKILKIYR
jgi:hypothetical protein